MSLYLDIKYLQSQSSRLRNFKQKNTDLWNCACPFCGDSKKNHLKARGYIFKANNYNGLGFRCWNCNISTNFANFLKFLDVSKYKEYLMEKFKDEGKHAFHSIESEPPKKDKEPKLAAKRFEDIKIPSVASLSKEHFARRYVEARKIPERFYKEIFFAADYKKFLDEEFPHHGKDKLKELDPRLVLFFTNRDGEITNVSGRSFEADAALRYIAVKVTDERKVYGLHRLKTDRPVYVTEGQFDSLFLDNAVASGDSNLAGTADYLKSELNLKTDPICVFDNEPRNREIVRTISDAARAGHPVVLWPSDFPGKDINDVIKEGWTEGKVHGYLRASIFQGLTAQLQLHSWRKC